MNIAVCDDEKECVEKIETHLQKLKKTYVNLKWKLFYNAEEMLSYISLGNNTFDILITDIEMGEMNGIELASVMRKNDKNLIIFFLTSHTDYAIQCFRPEPMNFWVKPIDYNILEQDIARAAERINQSMRCITITEERYPVRLNVRDIVYIEKSDRKIVLHMTDGSTHTTNKLISHIYAELPEDVFAMSYQSFIVNLSHIKILREKELVLRETDEILPVGRTYTDNLRKRFIKYRERRAFGDGNNI